jgi:hypothetical protein
MNLTSKTYITFSLALLVQIIALIIWYAFHPHLTLFSEYWPSISALFSGALIGLLDNQSYLRKTLILGVLMSVITSIIHWSAAQLGVPVDFGDASSSALLAIVGMPISIVLCMLGGTLGSLVYRGVFQRKRFGSK